MSTVGLMEVQEDSGGRFRVQVIEVTHGLVSHDKGFEMWAKEFLRPYLIAGKSVAIKLRNVPEEIYNAANQSES